MNEVQAMNLDFEALIREAWQMTWRRRSLWILGLLAGGAIGFPSARGGDGGVRWQLSRDDLARLHPDLARAADGAGIWFAGHGAVVVAAAVLFVALGLAFLVLSFIAQGALTRAATELAASRPSSLPRAWAAGVHLFWRYVGLWTLLALAAVAVAFAVAFLAVVAVALSTLAGSPAPNLALAGAAVLAVAAGFAALVVHVVGRSPITRGLLALVAFLVGLLVVPVVLALLVGASVVVTYAQRGIAVEDVGPLAALREGWRLFRAHLGESLILWVLFVALVLASFIAGTVVTGVLLAVIAGLGALLWSAVGVAGLTLGYAAVGTLAAIVALLTIAAFVGTFLWNYWTLAYLRLEQGDGRSPVAA